MESDLAGVGQILGLEARNTVLQSNISQLESDNAELQYRRPRRRRTDSRTGTTDRHLVQFVQAYRRRL